MLTPGFGWVSDKARTRTGVFEHPTALCTGLEVRCGKPFTGAIGAYSYNSMVGSPL